MPTLMDYFSTLEDPRQISKCRHNLCEVLFMATCAMLCGADDWESIELFSRTREPWFRKHLVLSNGVPSHDTFNRVFSLLDPVQFRRVYAQWVQALLHGTGLSGTVALDGKALKGSAWNKGKDAGCLFSVKNNQAGYLMRSFRHLKRFAKNILKTMKTRRITIRAQQNIGGMIGVVAWFGTKRHSARSHSSGGTHSRCRAA